MIGRLLRSLVGLLGTVAALVGIPAGLWLLGGGNPLPTDLSFAALRAALTSPDDGQLFIQVLVWVGWVAWAVFAVSIVAEFLGQISGRRITLPGLRLPQQTAAPLVAMLLAVFIAAPTIVAVTTGVAAANPVSPSPTPTTQIATPERHQTSTTTHDAAADKPSERASAATKGQGRDVVHSVDRNDSLWRLAERYYGDGMKWKMIAKANADLVGPDGVNFLEPGWELTIPNVPAQLHPGTDRDHGSAPKPGHTYTVERGDTLSEIAEDAYGDSSRWPRVAKANADLIVDPDQIDVGWKLDLPAAKKAPHISTPEKDDKQSGDKQGGDIQGSQADRTDRDHHPKEPKQPGPQPTQSSAPEPSATSEPTATTAASPGATEAAPTQAANPQPTAQVQESSPTEQAKSPADVAADTTSALPWALPASALLAAGIVGVIARRRHALSITRRPGRRLPALPDEAQQAVTALRQVEAPLTVAHLDRALRTLSAGLAAQKRDLPLITAVRLDDDRLDCRLVTADPNPPKPFTTTDGTVWTLSSDKADTLLDATLSNQVAAPYPALVTLGRDADGAHLLVDLETIAALTLATDSQADAHAVLAALAFELATSSWADDLTLTLVGVCPDLPAALGVDRARHVDHIDALIDSLESEAADAVDLLQVEHLGDAHQGRLDTDGADAWTPHIVLIGHTLDLSAQQRLAEVLTRLPRVAVAAVTTGGEPLTGWALHLDDEKDSAELAPLGLTITPQRLAGRSYDAVCDALRQSQNTDTEPAPWWNHEPSAHRPAELPSVSLQLPDPDDQPLDVADTADTEVAATSPRRLHVDNQPLDAVDTADAEVIASPRRRHADDADPEELQAEELQTDLQAEEPTVQVDPAPTGAAELVVGPASAGERNTEAATGTSVTEDAEPGSRRAGATAPPSSANVGKQDERAAAADDEVAQLVLLHRPTLLLLGDVQLVNVGGNVSSDRTGNEVLEPIAYVYLNPGRPTLEFKAAMSYRTSKPDELASRARRYLGAAPDGSRLFPPGHRDGTTRFYVLNPHVYSDWEHYQSLIVGGINTVSTAALTSALKLVRGRPLASVPVGMWLWAHDWREEAIATIVDTAHELTERNLSRGDIAGARWAVRQGRKVDELTEILARDEIRVERVAGNHGRVQRLTEQIIEVARENRVQPDPETVELLHEIRDGRRRRAQ